MTVAERKLMTEAVCAANAGAQCAPGERLGQPTPNRPPSRPRVCSCDGGRVRCGRRVRAGAPRQELWRCRHLRHGAGRLRLDAGREVRLFAPASPPAAAGTDGAGVARYEPNLEAAIEYFKQVAAATDLPFWPYWLGASLAATAKQFLAAMADVPNFQGMKCAPTPRLPRGALGRAAGAGTPRRTFSRSSRSRASRRRTAGSSTCAPAAMRCTWPAP